MAANAAVLRFALVGAGFMGGVHAANLAARTDLDLAVIYDVDASRATALARSHGGSVVADVAEAFDPAHIDAVLVASSTSTHGDHLRRAADAQLPVLCEKPIDGDLTSAINTARYVSDRAGRVMMSFNRRFDADYAEIRRIVDAGGVGSVELVQFTSRGPSMPPLDYLRGSGGLMRDSTVHFFDLARWLTGHNPVQVYAAGSTMADTRLREFGDVDTAAVTLQMPTGALVQIDSVRRTDYGYDERMEVLGSTGMVESQRRRTGGVARYGVGAITQDGLHPGWFERVQPTYAAILDHFIASVTNEQPFLPSLQDGLAAAAIAEAATASLITGRSELVSYADADRAH